MLKHARGSGPPAIDKVRHARTTEAGSGDKRPHVLTLAFGLLDAHVSGVDYFDTAGGEELMRLYHQRQVQRHRAA